MRRNVILDTCALIWVASGDKRLSKRARHVIDAAPTVCVSAISAWEISLKSARGELELPLPPIQWFHEAMRVHHLALADLSLDVLCRANELPWHHRDPADRFIIATAVIRNLVIATADKQFRDYPVDVIV